MNDYYSITLIFDVQKLRTAIGVSLFQRKPRSNVRTIYTSITLILYHDYGCMYINLAVAMKRLAQLSRLHPASDGLFYLMETLLI